MEATKTQTYAEVGAKFRISRQRVGQIVRRWKQYMPVRSLRVRKTDLGLETQHLPKKENRIHVISFRLTANQLELLQLRYPDMKSVDRAAREIVVKVLSI